MTRTECVPAEMTDSCSFEPSRQHSAPADDKQHSKSLDPPPLPPPPPSSPSSCRQTSINPGARLHSSVHHPPLGMRRKRACQTKGGGRGRGGKCLCGRNGFRFGRTMETLIVEPQGKQVEGGFVSSCDSTGAGPGRGGTSGGYLVMGASRSTGFFISNDRAGAHCSSLKPGDTLTRVLPLCAEKRKRQSQTNTAVGFG